MSDVSEMEKDIVEAALGIVTCPPDYRAASLKVLDLCVCRLLKVRAEANNETVDAYIERKRKLFMALAGDSK